MTTPSLADLVTVSTADQAKDRLLVRLAAKGCPITDWEEGGVERTLVEIDAQENADFSVSQQLITKSGFLSTALSDWLDLLGVEFYGLVRYPATYTLGPETLYCIAGAGPYTVQPGELWFSSPSTGLRYTNTTGGTVSSASPLSITIRAESPGSAYNATPGTITNMVTPLLGVTCTNPGSTTWPTTQGTDTESNELYSQRCTDRWATLGYSANADWYRYYSRNEHAYASSITRVKVVTNPGGIAGTVGIYLAGPSGAPSGAATTAADASIQAKKPDTVNVGVVGTPETTLAVTATCYVTAAYAAAFSALATLAIQAAINANPVGEIFHVSAIEKAIMNIPGAHDVVVSAPVTSTDPGSTGILVPGTITLTIVTV